VEGYESTVDGYDITNTAAPTEQDDPEGPGDSDDKDDQGDDPEKETDKDTGNAEQGSDADDDTENTLPKTATDIYNYLLAGLVFIILATGLYILSRRRRNA